MTFCVECGREGPVIGGLCAPCFASRNPLARPPEALDVGTCGSCGRLDLGRSWSRVDLEVAIPILLARGVPVDPRARGATFTHTSRAEDDRNLLLSVKLAAKVEGVEIVEAFRTRLRLKATVCPTCSRQKGSYYEAILQIRAEDRDVGPEERARLLGLIDEAIARRTDRGEEVFVTKVEDVRGGTDVYLSSNGFAKAVSRELADRYRGTLGSSPKLVGRRLGKDVYRVTYVVRLPP